VKLLIDDCYSGEVARLLRRSFGHDAVSASEHPALRGRPDSDLYELAQAQGRVLVTENVVDFAPLAMESQARGEQHHGLVFTSNERFPRSRPGTSAELAAALNELAKEEGSEEPFVRWL
jgi:hypothetical protein